MVPDRRRSLLATGAKAERAIAEDLRARLAEAHARRAALLTVIADIDTALAPYRASGPRRVVREAQAQERERKDSS